MCAGWRLMINAIISSVATSAVAGALNRCQFHSKHASRISLPLIGTYSHTGGMKCICTRIMRIQKHSPNVHHPSSSRSIFVFRLRHNRARRSICLHAEMHSARASVVLKWIFLSHISADAAAPAR
jgi:hypothetical protein